jgi:hypothetical protein
MAVCSIHSTSPAASSAPRRAAHLSCEGPLYGRSRLWPYEPTRRDRCHHSCLSQGARASAPEPKLLSMPPATSGYQLPRPPRYVLDTLRRRKAWRASLCLPMMGRCWWPSGGTAPIAFATGSMLGARADWHIRLKPLSGGPRVESHDRSWGASRVSDRTWP